MSWIILTIALMLSISAVAKLVLAHSDLRNNDFKGYEFSAYMMLLIAIVWVLPFYLNHWPTLY